MSGSFPKEQLRTDAIKEIFGRYLVNKCLRSIDKTDITMEYGGYMGVIFEVKNEVGTGSCDSYMEMLVYYFKSIPSRISPANLIEIVGVHMAIYGAVYAETVCVDRLSPCLWLTLQPYDIQSMTNLTSL